MRRYRFLHAILALAVLPAVPAVAAQQSFIDTYAGAIEAMLDESLAESNGGMVIGLVDEHGSRVFSAGRLDNGTDRAVDGDTIFELGSVTKVFTSLLLLDAVRRGEVKLDDPVAKYLPDDVKMPSYEGKEITLVHLAAQESGLPFHAAKHQRILEKGRTKQQLEELKLAADAYTAKDLYAFLSEYELSSAPGIRFQYSNLGMALLGHVLENKTGADYETLVVGRIAHPLAMERTLIKLTPELRSRLARGHWTDGTRSEHLNFQVMQPAGSLLSTADDLVKFLSTGLGFTDSHLTALIEQSLVVRHTGAEPFGKTAMPWFDQGVYNPPGTEILAHGGGGFGNLAFLGFDTKKRRGVVVLSNQMNVNPSGIGWTLLQGMPLTRENITYWVREIVGLGVALETDARTGAIRIIRVFPESPAGKAGLTAGLVVKSVNGVSVEGKTVQDCLTMLGGPPGVIVRLDLFDADQKKTRTVELTRQKFLTAMGKPFGRTVQDED